MAKKKLQRFKEVSDSSRVVEVGYFDTQKGSIQLKGQWNKQFFNNTNDLVLELGCGKGEYTVGMARYYPKRNFIGVDIKGARIWRGAKTIDEEKINNAGFLRTQIGLLPHFFDKNEVSEIWITFPDPQPGSRVNKRLTSPRFLHRYAMFLKPEGVIHLKTDSDLMYAYTLETITEEKHILIQSDSDIYANQNSGPLTDIRTFYEQMWLEQGKKIKFIAFKLNPAYYETAIE